MVYAIAHSGIKGQKWGHRRYQYEDGSLTPAGRERYRKQNSKKTKYAEVDPDPKATKQRNERTQNRLNTSKGAIDAAGQAAGRASSYLKNQQKNEYNADKYDEAKSMSDQELRDAVNRMNLERQYVSLSYETTGTGKSVATDILDTAGTVLAIAGSAVGIAAGIHAIRKG